MGKTLRVCLAMGGGVSLGSFSGSALTEALKLLILYGRDREEGNPYDKVIVDGMSGASAGAVALTILLKCLVDYKAMINIERSNGGTLTEDTLLTDIAKAYFKGDESAAKKNPHIEELKALELAQKIQRTLWVEKLNTNDLYGEKKEKDYKLRLHDSFGLLDRDHIQKLTRKYLMDEDFNIANVKVLDEKRVLFACSLTNLLPMEIDIAKENAGKLADNVLKSVGSENHTELRVIDFVFDEAGIQKKPTDDRWLKFCQNPDTGIPTHFDIASKEAWATLAASAIACGNFPIAFEPLPLKRYREEYIIDRKGKNNESEWESNWPKPFKEVRKEIDNYKKGKGLKKLDKHNSYFNEESDNEEPGARLDYNSFNFPYIDGGTFNNEPIREAFKMASFQDFILAPKKDKDEDRTRDPKQEDRLILFVDPAVRLAQYHPFRLSSFEGVKPSKKDKAKPSTEFSKLSGSVAGLVSMLWDQGSVKEEHRIRDTKENFALRDDMFEYLNGIDDSKNEIELTVGMLETAFEKVSKNLKNHIISPGTRKPEEYLAAEIHRYCAEGGAGNACILKITADDLKKVKEIIGGVGENKMSKVYEALGIKKGNEDEGWGEQNAFARAVLKLVSDFALNTVGKNQKAENATILPINEELHTIELPGDEIAAFGGFASLKAREYAFEYGRLSALLSLKEKGENGFRRKRQEEKEKKEVPTPFIAEIADSAAANFSELKEILKNKITNTGFFAEEYDYGADLKKNLYEPTFERLENMLPAGMKKFLVTKVPFMVTAIFGPILSLFMLGDKIKNKTPWRLKGVKNNLTTDGMDAVNYLDTKPITICIVSKNQLKKKKDRRIFITIKDAANQPKKLEPVAYELKENKVTTGYQYLFQAYRLEYFFDEETEEVREMDAKEDIPVWSNVEPRHIKKMEISLSKRVAIPPALDGNLEPGEKRKLFEESYAEIIEEVKIGERTLPPLSASINDQSSALHYSLKSIDFHINPVLEIDLDKLSEEKGWYFKECTESLDKKLLRSDRNSPS